MLAVGLTLAFAAAAVGVDYARAVAMRQSLSLAADAAALAAASRLPDVEAAQKIALEYVEKNLPQAQYGKALVPADVQLGYWNDDGKRFIPLDGSRSDSSDSESGGSSSSLRFTDAMMTTDSLSKESTSATTKESAPSEGGASGSTVAVRVTTRLAESNGNPLGTLFAGLFGNDSFDVSVSAVAGRGSPPCVLALDPTASPSMLLNWRASVETRGCAVQVNSTAEPALEVTDNASLDSLDICVGGTARDTAGGVNPEPQEYCPGISDPLAGMTPPDHDGCDHVDSRPSGHVTLEPGTYCGGLRIGAFSNVTLSPGVYVIKDGPFRLAGLSSLTGSDVTIILTGTDAVISVWPGAKMELTAPTSGEFTGVLFFQDPEFGGDHYLGGMSTTTLRGVIYLPSGRLVSHSDSDITPEGSCMVLIANSLKFEGFSKVLIDISSSNCRRALPGAYRRGIVLLQ